MGRLRRKRVRHRSTRRGAWVGPDDGLSRYHCYRLSTARCGGVAALGLGIFFPRPSRLFLSARQPPMLQVRQPGGLGAISYACESAWLQDEMPAMASG